VKNIGYPSISLMQVAPSDVGFNGQRDDSVICSQFMWDFRLQDDCGLACGDYVSPFYLCAFACVLGIRKHACAYGWFHQGFVLSLKENDVQLEVSQPIYQFS